MGGDATKIENLTGDVASLNKQLEGERGVVITRNKEVQLLSEQLSEERHKNAKKR